MTKKILIGVLITIVVIGALINIFETVRYLFEGGDDAMVDEIVIGISQNIIDYLEGEYFGEGEEGGECLENCDNVSLLIDKAVRTVSR